MGESPTPGVHFFESFFKVLPLIRAQNGADGLIGLGANLFVLGAELHRESAVSIPTFLDDILEVFLLVSVHVQTLRDLFDDVSFRRYRRPLCRILPYMILVEIAGDSPAYASEQKNRYQHQRCARL